MNLPVSMPKWGRLQHLLHLFACAPHIRPAASRANHSAHRRSCCLRQSRRSSCTCSDRDCASPIRNDPSIPRWQWQGRSSPHPGDAAWGQPTRNVAVPVSAGLLHRWGHRSRRFTMLSSGSTTWKLSRLSGATELRQDETLRPTGQSVSSFASRILTVPPQLLNVVFQPSTHKSLLTALSTPAFRPKPQAENETANGWARMSQEFLTSLALGPRDAARSLTAQKTINAMPATNKNRSTHVHSPRPSRRKTGTTTQMPTASPPQARNQVPCGGAEFLVTVRYLSLALRPPIMVIVP